MPPKAVSDGPPFGLTSRQIEVLQYRYWPEPPEGKPPTLKRIAAMLGFTSHERVRQIEDGALKRLMKVAPLGPKPNDRSDDQWLLIVALYAVSRLGEPDWSKLPPPDVGYGGQTLVRRIARSAP